MVELFSNNLTNLITFLFVTSAIVVSPGADFALVTKNSICFSRKSGIFTALGIATAIWIHVIYTLTGIGLLISNSPTIFSVIKYSGAIYLIYIGIISLKSKNPEDLIHEKVNNNKLPGFHYFKTGFITNSLNPKTTIFFLSFFSQFITLETPISVQFFYGLIVSLFHFFWFILVSFIFSSQAILNNIGNHKHKIEKVIGIILIIFGLSLAFDF